ncbi:hypothetical protein [Pontibacter sp. G13]|uniref:hypothetical protein n=1 Tax=Pontibacter sp. G13 TaxID=3074898 RepID=UPI002889FACF|nr:hypothetical protein [Pontibacter sp. G13]WNJ17121.1 hypothetical protein RJD25_19880 [Pontibacter sp. G13]
MNPEEFVKNVFKEKEDLVRTYSASNGQTHVNKLIESLDLTAKQKEILIEAIDGVLTDGFYTLLLGLDGVASIGEKQEMYKLTDEQGNELTGGEIEAFAWEYFHNK